jgi:hypothetical protein
MSLSRPDIHEPSSTQQSRSYGVGLPHGFPLPVDRAILSEWQRRARPGRPNPGRGRKPVKCEFSMISKDLMLRMVRMFADEPPQTFKDIAATLSMSNPPIPMTPEKAGEKVREACRWLLREQQKLDDIRRSEILSEELQGSLRKKYPVLIGAKVVRCGPIVTALDYRNLERVMGQVAAEYFDELLEYLEHRRDIDDDEPIDVVLSGGESVLDMVSSLAEIPRPNVTFHPAALIGRGPMVRSTHIGPETTATIGWSRSGRNSGRLNYATVSPDESGFDAKREPNEHMSPKQHRDRLEEIQQCLHVMFDTDAVHQVVTQISMPDLAVVTLGLLDPEIVEDADRFSMIGLVKGLGLSPQLLHKDGVIGDISYCFFTREGGTRPEWNLFLTPGYPKKTAVEFYREMVKGGKPVMVIAGTRKEELLRTALNSRLINILITDEHTARLLLEAS